MEISNYHKPSFVLKEKLCCISMSIRASLIVFINGSHCQVQTSLHSCMDAFFFSSLFYEEKNAHNATLLAQEEDKISASLPQEEMIHICTIKSK